jgi:hypothetical protein
MNKIILNSKYRQLYKMTLNSSYGSYSQGNLTASEYYKQIKLMETTILKNIRNETINLILND